jgi:dipeptidyl aminopeptidase/acylaminoacyl peptidase
MRQLGWLLMNCCAAKAPNKSIVCFKPAKKQRHSGKKPYLWVKFVSMTKNLFTLGLGLSAIMSNAQQKLSPEKLWELGKLSPVVSQNDKLIYQVSHVNLKDESKQKNLFMLDLNQNKSQKIENLGKKSIFQWDKNGIYALEDGKIYRSTNQGQQWDFFYDIQEADGIVVSPDGKKIAFSKEVLLENIMAKDRDPKLYKSTAHVYDSLNDRHWDSFNKGKYSHVFVVEINQPVSQATDILAGKPFDCPQKPHGGTEDFIWSPDAQQLIYVCKALSGKAYAMSTNTDIFAYHLQNKSTKNLTEGMMGYDMNPKFSPDGQYLSFTSMKRDGYEADKNDIILLDWQSQQRTNLTERWDATIDADYVWHQDGTKIYANAAHRGLRPLFEINISTKKVTQLSDAKADVAHLIGQYQDKIWLTSTDMNHAPEIANFDLKSYHLQQVSQVNTEAYSQITPSKTELKIIKTTDGKEMGVWMIYPPDFDPNKTYPSLLYCQGGPQSALTQTYSLRWNFALMAAQGYIVIAPNRRGMPGWGTAWNEQISQDWGGQAMQDYLAAADYARELPFINKNKMACVGASYGGYSSFMLAGIHQGRFKSFIAHNGIFNTKSWYGTTEELWFAKWDLGEPYYQNPNNPAFTKFNPSEYVKDWTSPILIYQSALDFRVPFEQGHEAFQAAQMRGIKSKLVYFEDENHWILKPHNALLWQKEFFGWLNETLNK